MGTERMIEVPLHEYEELVRDSERLRIITERAARAARKMHPGIETGFILLVAGYQETSKEDTRNHGPQSGKAVAPAQQVRPEIYIDRDKLTERIAKSMQDIERHLGGTANE